MQRLIQMRNSWIVAVGRQQVLDKIISADREEIHLRDEPRRERYRRWHFDHNPDRDIGVMLEALLVQLGLRLSQEFARPAQLLEARYHREHDAGVMARGGAQDRAQLDFEDTRHLERNPDRAPSEERVVLARYAQIRRIFVRADIKRADRDGAIPHRVQHAVVKRELLLFVREILVGKKRKLRAQQPHTFGAVAQGEFDIRKQRDIREHLHAMPVARRDRLAMPHHQHTMADVAKVRCLLAQIAVRKRQHRRAELVDYAKERALSRITRFDCFANAADEFLVLENQAMGVEDSEIRLGHQRRHPDLERDEFAARTDERLFEPLLFGLGITGAQIAIDRTEKNANDVRDSAGESRCGRKADQARAANFYRRGNARRAPHFLITFELPIGLDHPPAIFVALLLLGGKRLAQLEMRHDLRDLACRGSQQAHLILAELAPPESLRDQYAKRLVTPLLDRHTEEGVVALLAGFGEIFIARMAYRILDHHRLP